MEENICKWIKVSEREPKSGDYYYVKVDTKQDNIQSTICEWFKYPNGKYDWAIADIQHYGGFRDDAEVIEWLDENYQSEEKKTLEQPKTDEYCKGCNKDFKTCQAISECWISIQSPKTITLLYDLYRFFVNYCDAYTKLPIIQAKKAILISRMESVLKPKKVFYNSSIIVLIQDIYDFLDTNGIVYTNEEIKEIQQDLFDRMRNVLKSNK